ncbi:MAG: hypothetical protein CME71_04855 [Halobacteriovorax sp.]|nr:hypothetical protein [Halobacteriovorax sp.]
MLERPINGKDAIQRVLCLDFLRGFFVFLALWQHFAYYLNFWYLDYHGGWSFWGELFSPHSSFVGQQIPVDGVSHWAAWFFTPWVSQVYLFLAAFNLAKSRPESIKVTFKNKTLLFLGLFFLFSAENLIVAPNIGEAFSIYPLQIWMLLLGLLLVAERFFGERGIWFLFVFGLTKFGLPVDEAFSSLELVLQEIFHKRFEFDARPNYFLSSAALGFLMGKAWWSQNIKRVKIWTALGVACMLVWLAFGPSFSVDPLDVFKTEHDLADSFLGLIGIHGIELLVVGAFLLIKDRGFDINVSLFNWVGRYSLLVFFLHRIVFLKMIMPLRMLLASWFGWQIEGQFWEFWLYACIVFLMAWLIKKFKILVYLEGRA